jgi:hypothetical protein
MWHGRVFVAAVVVPPAPVNVTIISTTDTSVFVVWQAPPMLSGSIVQYVVMWSPRASNNGIYQAFVNSSITEYNISGLTPGTSYMIQVMKTKLNHQVECLLKRHY